MAYASRAIHIVVYFTGIFSFFGLVALICFGYTYWVCKYYKNISQLIIIPLLTLRSGNTEPGRTNLRKTRDQHERIKYVADDGQPTWPDN